MRKCGKNIAGAKIYSRPRGFNIAGASAPRRPRRSDGSGEAWNVAETDATDAKRCSLASQPATCTAVPYGPRDASNRRLGRKIRLLVKD